MRPDNMPLPYAPEHIGDGEQIKRYSLRISNTREGECGEFVLYSDHLADKEASRAEDRAEITRLTAICRKWQAHYESAISIAEARIAELEALLSDSKVKQADSLVNDDEAVRRDAMRLRQFELWANEGLCPHLVFNDNGWWAVTFDGGGDVSLREPPPSGTFTASVEDDMWRRTAGEAIDAAIAAAKSTT